MPSGRLLLDSPSGGRSLNVNCTVALIIILHGPQHFSKLLGRQPLFKGAEAMSAFGGTRTNRGILNKGVLLWLNKKS